MEKNVENNFYKDVEYKIIGSIFLDDSIISKIYNFLKPKMFDIEILGKIYLFMLQSYDIGEKIDIVIISCKLQDCGYDENIINNEIKICLSQTLTSVEYNGLVKIMQRKYKKKKTREIINNFSINLETQNIDDLISSTINDLMSLTKNKENKVKSLKKIVDENKEKYFTDKRKPFILTGFKKLDEKIVSLERGNVTVIGARPNVGKSAFSSQLVKNIVSQKKRGIIYNLEMSEEQIYERMIAQESNINLQRVRTATEFRENEKLYFDHANDKLSNYNLYIKSGIVKPMEIMNDCRHMCFDFIVIDYLQLMRPDNNGSLRYQEIGEIFNTLKFISMELSVHIIVLSQLNRASIINDRKPNASDLRESGDIEQTASVILLIHEPNKENTNEKLFIIEKNRQGTKGEIPMFFDGSIMKFVESVDETNKDEDGFIYDNNLLNPFN